MSSLVLIASLSHDPVERGIRGVIGVVVFFTLFSLGKLFIGAITKPATKPPTSTNTNQPMKLNGFAVTIPEGKESQEGYIHIAHATQYTINSSER